MTTQTEFKMLWKSGEDGEWPDSWSEVETSVSGDLADRVRRAAHATPDAPVTLWERGQDGGYSEYTTEWEVVFEVRVDGECVFRDDFDSICSLDAETGQLLPLEDWQTTWGNGLSRLIAWLDKSGADA